MYEQWASACAWSSSCMSGEQAHTKLHLSMRWALVLVQKAPLVQAEDAWVEGVYACVWNSTCTSRRCLHMKLHINGASSASTSTICLRRWSFVCKHKCPPLVWRELCAGVQMPAIHMSGASCTSASILLSCSKLYLCEWRVRAEGKTEGKMYEKLKPGICLWV